MSRPAASCWSSSTAGGWRRTGPGNAVVAGRHAGVRRAVGRAPAHDADRVRRERRAARRARWATPRSATSTSAPARSSRRTSRASTSAVEDGTLAENEVLQAALKDAAARAPDRARLRRRRALVRPPPEGADRAGRRAGVDDLVVHAFTDGRDTSPKGGAKYLAEVEAGARRRGAGRPRDRPLLRDGPRQALGPHRRRPTTCSCTARPSTTRRPAPTAGAAAYERDETDEFIAATTVGEEARIRPGDAVIALQLPPRPHARDHARAGRPGFDEIDRGGAGWSSATRRSPSTRRTGTIRSSSRPSARR